MKKLILFFVVIFIAAGAFAQNKPEWGVKAGLNLAGQITPGCCGKEISDERYGLHAGVFAEIEFLNRFGFQPELMYSMQGGAENNRVEKLDYISLPLMLKFYINRKRTISVNAGPQFGYLIRAKYNGKDGLESVQELNKFDVSLGGGVSFKLDKNLGVGLRIVKGMTDIGPTRISETAIEATGISRDNLWSKNALIQIGVECRF